MKTKNISQTVSFRTTPPELYRIFMDPKRHSAISGSKAKISQKINGKFEVFEGYCHGYNIALKEGKKIVQAWHFAEDGWPDDHFSICTFEFSKAPIGTKLKFKQTGVPEHKVSSLKDGWKQFYWEPIKKYLLEKN